MLSEDAVPRSATESTPVAGLVASHQQIAMLVWQAYVMQEASNVAKLGQEDLKQWGDELVRTGKHPPDPKQRMVDWTGKSAEVVRAVECLTDEFQLLPDQVFYSRPGKSLTNDLYFPYGRWLADHPRAKKPTMRKEIHRLLRLYQE